MSPLFKINNIDYTSRVIIGSYELNSKEDYEEYKDANGTKHRNVVTSKVSGKLDIFFKSMSDYNTFLNDIDRSKNIYGRVPLTVVPNNTNIETDIEAYVEFEPKRTTDGSFRDRMMQFSVNIEEA